MLLPYRLKIRHHLAVNRLQPAQSPPRPPHRAASRPQVVRTRVSRPQAALSRPQPVVDRVSRPQVVLSRPRPVVGRVSRPQVVRSLPQPVVDRVNHLQVVRTRPHPLVLVPPHRVVSRLLLALPHHPPRSLKAFTNPVIFDEMAGFLRSALGWPGSQLKVGEVSLYFYRDTDQQEVCLLVESGDTLYPLGVKKTASPWQTQGASLPCSTSWARRSDPAPCCAW